MHGILPLAWLDATSVTIPLVKRHLFNVLAAISLLLCVATACLWLRSFWHEDAACYRTHNAIRVIAVSQPGRVWFEKIHEVSIWAPSPTTNWGAGFWVYSVPHQSSDDAWQWEKWYSNDDYIFRRWGFRVVRGDRLTPVPSPDPEIFGTCDFFPAAAVALPYWFVVPLAAVLPAIAVRRHLRSRHSPQAGHCQLCGYDLRATPWRCPECGTIPIGAKS